MTEKLESILNSEQYEAATAGDGPLLILQDCARLVQ